MQNQMTYAEMKLLRAIFGGSKTESVELPAELAAALDEAERSLASLRHARKHASHRPGGLRGVQRGRRELAEAGRCQHGVYVGGCGVDWMCGACEQGNTRSKSQAVNSAKRWASLDGDTESPYYDERLAKRLAR